jgi:hypothetical protein
MFIRLAALGAPIAVKRRAVNRSTKKETPCIMVSGVYKMCYFNMLKTYMYCACGVVCEYIVVVSSLVEVMNL